MAKAQRLVGIDFGTSTSVIRTKRYQNGEPIGDSFSSSCVTFGNGEGDTKAATVVRRNADGSYTCGMEGEEPVPGGTVFREFKMRLESPDENEREEARELTRAFFRYLFERYDHQRSDLGEPDDGERTLVSVPVKWQQETRDFMAEAASSAGFPNVEIMEEPTAALYATLCRKMSELNQQKLLRTGESGYLLMVDMGAGTTDLAVCRYNIEGRPGEIIRADRIKNEIVAVWPENMEAATFGGREVDRVLEQYVMDYLLDCGLTADMAAKFVQGNNNTAAKRWKESTVSPQLNRGDRVETCGFISNIMLLLPQQKSFPALGRGEFQEMLADKLDGFKRLVADCLQKASQIEPQMMARQLDLAILTGGHSAWYFNEDLLNGSMPGLELSHLQRLRLEKGRVVRLSNPQETVALGLVYSWLPFTVREEGKAASPEPQKSQQESEVDFQDVFATARRGVAQDIQRKEEKRAVSEPQSFAGKAASTLIEKFAGDKAPSAPIDQFAVSKPRSARKMSDEEINDALAWNAKDFIQTYDDFLIYALQKTGEPDRLLKRLKIPQGDKVFLCHDNGFYGPLSIKHGFVIGYSGICYISSGLVAFPEKTSWLEFTIGEIKQVYNIFFSLTLPGGKVNAIGSYTGPGGNLDEREKISSALFEFFCGLQAHLRYVYGQLKEKS